MAEHENLGAQFSNPDLRLVTSTLRSLGVLATPDADPRVASPHQGVDMYRVISADRQACGGRPLPPDVIEPVDGFMVEFLRQGIKAQGRLLD